MLTKLHDYLKWWHSHNTVGLEKLWLSMPKHTVVIVHLFTLNSDLECLTTLPFNYVKDFKKFFNVWSQNLTLKDKTCWLKLLILSCSGCIFRHLKIRIFQWSLCGYICKDVWCYEIIVSLFWWHLIIFTVTLMLPLIRLRAFHIAWFCKRRVIFTVQQPALKWKGFPNLFCPRERSCSR